MILASLTRGAPRRLCPGYSANTGTRAEPNFHILRRALVASDCDAGGETGATCIEDFNLFLCGVVCTAVRKTQLMHALLATECKT